MSMRIVAPVSLSDYKEENKEERSKERDAAKEKEKEREKDRTRRGSFNGDNNRAISFQHAYIFLCCISFSD